MWSSQVCVFHYVSSEFLDLAIRKYISYHSCLDLSPDYLALVMCNFGDVQFSC